MSEWRDIPGYDGLYQIDRMGQVRSWKWRIGRRATKPHLLVPFVRKRGARGKAVFVKLTAPDGAKPCDVKVISLMRDVWMGGPRQGMVIYHKNGDLRDNCLHNLGFISRQKLGEKTGAQATRRPVVKINQAGEIVEVYPSARSAAKANHMSYQTVLDRCNGKVKKPFALDGHTYAFENRKME